ncbi:hypothetical protein [Deinococcus radiophilus]|uniref:Uncharacterized protein n=1 Tax=Deinococcus radiophilus TaxID=32062 RepID=A0A431W5S2_9DEIO|nr:hypothetical protein [Deinococcus radiophilus]RTR30761.1 hypothetical protein EJ104_00450 [Deinococcus radiophilus]UFA51315.1 hypothetical protein LMT64_05320 [Deinococcus radiophilus]
MSVQPSATPAPPNARFNPWKYLGFVALLFLLLVGSFTALLLSRGKDGRAYAQQALAAADTLKFAAGAEPTCQEILNQAPPQTVQSCVVYPERTPMQAEVMLLGGRRSVINAR